MSREGEGGRQKRGDEKKELHISIPEQMTYN